MEQVDVLVIGGGIHGVGVAQAAAAAGYRVAVVEQKGLAAGTSSKSSKLIHGGLRYLEQGNLRLVRESLRERELLLRLAPGLIRRLPLRIPIYRATRRRAWQIQLGLAAYALLAGLRRETGFRQLPAAEWDKLDGLSTRNLQSVFEFTDAQTDDAELTRAVMASATGLGATLWCPAEFLRAARSERGYDVVIRYGDTEKAISATTLVNATGPWSRNVLARLNPVPRSPLVELVQGAHLEIAGSMPHGGYYLEAPQDRRAVFVLPWRDRTLVGTTETAFRGDPSTVLATSGEIEYLLATYQAYFPERATTMLDSWAGIRVLPQDDARSAFQRSRETRLIPDTRRRPHCVSILGGKLTTYRLTAERVIAKLRHVLPSAPRKARTEELSLSLSDGFV